MCKLDLILCTQQKLEIIGALGKLGEEQGVAGGGGLGEGLSRDRGQEARGQEELHCHPGSQLELVGDEVGEGGEGCVLCLGQ